MPIDDDGGVGDDTRIRATLPTIEFLRTQGASLVLMSHLGRPKGKPDPRYSLRPVAQRLSQLLEADVRFPGAVTGPHIEAAAADLGHGELLLLENTRFDPVKPAMILR